MKKLTLLLFIAISSFAFSQGMKIISGNFDFLKDQAEVNTEVKSDHVLFYVENMSEEQYLEKRKKEVLGNPKKTQQDWDKWINEWNSHKANIYAEKVITGFNEKSKKIKLNKGIVSKYTLIVDTKWIYPGWHGGMLIQPAKLTTDLKFIETENPSHVVLHLEASGVQGNGSSAELYMEYGRIAASFKKTGKDLGKKVKEALK
ncbi:hypothetical protein [Chryseobacterium flavum]|uniref:hypothetical protein n=1 Tax=Chryseobacterium flavum TaxID=415851 RepID=UPI0028B0DD66|nr:hypothetical protein [Chryseobacterium flavum]